VTQLFGKFGFIHRHLWGRSSAYRAGLLLGPVPLLGAGVAFLVWALASGMGIVPSRAAQWAPTKHPSNWDAVPGVSTVQPTVALPATARDGTLVGYRREWQVTTHGFRVSPSWQIDVDETPLAATSISGPTFDISRFFTEPQRRLHAAVGSAMFVVKDSGRYTLSASFERPAGPPANCLTRVVFFGRWLLSHIETSLLEDTVRTYDGASFNLTPGLYPINFMFTCWNGPVTKGPGSMTLLVQHPGEDTPSPARMVEIVRPRAARP
jgi:hypothetical protein